MLLEDVLFVAADAVSLCRWPAQTRQTNTATSHTHTHSYTYTFFLSSYVNTRLCTGVREGDR